MQVMHGGTRQAPQRAHPTAGSDHADPPHHAGRARPAPTRGRRRAFPARGVSGQGGPLRPPGRDAPADDPVHRLLGRPRGAGTDHPERAGRVVRRPYRRKSRPRPRTGRGRGGGQHRVRRRRPRRHRHRRVRALRLRGDDRPGRGRRPERRRLRRGVAAPCGRLGGPYGGRHRPRPTVRPGPRERTRPARESGHPPLGRPRAGRGDPDAARLGLRHPLRRCHGRRPRGGRIDPARPAAPPPPPPHRRTL